MVNRSIRTLSVIGFLTAHAVSRAGAGSQPQNLSTTIGHGMEPKIFWTAKSGRGIQWATMQADPALILMGDWCSQGLTLKRNEITA
ncbi:MAG: hypothetical protein Tsb0017_17280 [Geothermobacteraceae bacterium]